MSTTSTTPLKGGVAGYFIFMAVAIIFLYVLNNISTNQIQPIDPSLSQYYAPWLVNIINTLATSHVPYLTRFFISCLWAVNLFLGFCIMGNFTLLLYRPRWFHHLVMLIICTLALLAVYVFYHVFPLDIYTESNITLAKIIIWVIMAGVGVALVLRLVQFIKALNERERPQLPPDLPVSPLPTDLPAGSAQPAQSDTPQVPTDAPAPKISLD
jgi:hypothetical protein